MKLHKNSSNQKTYSRQITIGLTILCAIHCIFTPILLILLPVAGAYFEKYHWVEYIIIASVILVGSSAILHGYKDHHQNKLPVYIFFAGIVLLCTSSILKFMFNIHDIS